MINNILVGERYRFTILSNQLLRMEYSETGEFVDETTQVVVNRKITDEVAIEFNTIETADDLEIITKYFHLYYKKNQPFSNLTLFIDFFFAYQPYGNRWYYGDPIKDLKGTTRTLDWVDGETPLDSGIISFTGFTVLDDSQSHYLNAAGDFTLKNLKTTDVYVFAYGHEYQKALTTYYQLTGFTPKLPRYALGNWWSRFWRYSDPEYRNLITKFKTKEIPLSVAVIDMDWHITDIPEGFGSGWTGYSWNKELFPDPADFMNWLHEEGLAVTLNLHPADGVRAFEDAYPAMAQRLGLDVKLNEPAVLDFSDSDFRKAYFEEVLHPNEVDGVDFWWIDWQQGTDSGVSGLDPLWLLNHYHYLDLEKRGKNALILSRYAGPGSHRYPLGFSGDTINTWDSLKFQPYMTSTAANIGYSWWSHDIGGHMYGYKDEELVLRWLQLGVFSPINRIHSSNSIFMGKEPWNYSMEIEVIMTHFLRLRHQLLPYLYTANIETHEKGIPLVRPLYYGEADKPISYNYPNEFYFGSELLVLPITSPINSMLYRAVEEIYFPDGQWYDFWTNLRYQGGASLRVYRKLDRMPVFAKAGAIIPLDYSPMATGFEELPEVITWKIYPGASNQYRLVEEKDNQRVETILDLNNDTHTLQLTINGQSDVLPANRQHDFIFCGTQAFSVEGYDSDYQAQRKEVSIKGIKVETSLQLAIQGFAPIVKQDIKAELFSLVNEAKIAYVIKEEIWQNFQQDNVTKILSNTQRIQNKVLEESLFELIYIMTS
ncbi:glycoside hydrolase family 31 protein [Fundicoccus sp. Sow4_F4]|uniref:glycoside hydrolase family 31 protein n=1 Tax=Fundicoccus sp. Sow4_F4 TaxID=3438783 RepID=UPI003F8F0ABC